MIRWYNNRHEFSGAEKNNYRQLEDESGGAGNGEAVVHEYASNGARA